MKNAGAEVRGDLYMRKESRCSVNGESFRRRRREGEGEGVEQERWMMSVMMMSRARCEAGGKVEDT